VFIMTNDYAREKDINRLYWDALVGVNTDIEGSDGYNIKGFLKGERDLHPIELRELDDLSGRTLLHLQCHFGLDTLLLARKGATVTGFDYSEAAIDKARWLAAEAGMEARFVRGDIYDAPDLIDGTFDAVFVSWGALNWLPDIEAWAKVVAHFVKPGGWFYLAEGHPMAHCIDDEVPDGPVRVRYPYFHKPDPIRFNSTIAYADNKTKLAVTETHEWAHPVGEVVTSLIDAGLRLEFLHEHPEITWKAMPYLVPGDSGQYRMPDDRPNMPLSYSLKAVKPLG
jgi:SAM-dependent methyltransferase